MGKAEKRLGKVPLKYRPESPPKSLAPGGPKKARPRYRAEERFSWRRANEWWPIGYAGTMAEAEHLARKPFRSWVGLATRGHLSRVIDTATGMVVLQLVPPLAPAIARP